MKDKNQELLTGKNVVILLGLIALIAGGVYLLMNREPHLTGVYYSEARATDEQRVIEISDDNRMSYSFEDTMEGIPYELTIHYNLEPFGKDSYVITETDGFYIDMVYKGDEDDVEEFVETITESMRIEDPEWIDIWIDIRNEGNQKVATFSPRRMSAREMRLFDLWNFEDFVLTVRDGNLYVGSQMFVK